MLSARKKVRLTVLEAGGRDDLVDETALGKSVFVLVSLLELDTEELCKAAFPREVEPFLLQHVDQLVNVAGVLGSDSGVVDVQNNQHVVGVEEAGIVGGLFEAEFIEGLADMVEPKDWGHCESVETLDEAKTGVGALCGTETSGKVDPDRFLQLGLDERGAEVDGDGGPVEDQGEDEEDANGRPSNDGGVGALLVFLKVSPYAVPSLVLLYFTVGGPFAAKGPGSRKDFGGGFMSGDFLPCTLVDQGLDFNLCGLLPLSLVRRVHGFIVGKGVGVLGSFGLEDKVGGVGRQGGVQEAGEVGEVSISLGAVKAEAVDWFACAVRAAKGRGLDSGSGRRRGLELVRAGRDLHWCFLPLIQRCGTQRRIW